MINHKAVFALYPLVATVSGEDAFDKDGNRVEYDRSAVGGWIDPDLYKAQRAAAYPSITDQLDALWKGGDAAAEMLTRVQAVKTEYPKP